MIDIPGTPEVERTWAAAGLFEGDNRSLYQRQWRTARGR